MTKLLITDLDNTLYDWVSFFYKSFDEMLREIENITKLPREILLNEFKEVHQKHHNTEHPFAALELPSVQRALKSSSREQLYTYLDPAFHAFNRARKKYLKSYPEVVDTLTELKHRGVKIVAHTEATHFNSVFRAVKLGLDEFFEVIYTTKESEFTQPHPHRESALGLPRCKVVELPKEERKPNPALLEDIIRRHNADKNETVYVGDSLSKDVYMANEVGVTSAWAEYGRNFDQSAWDLLVKITHWTDEDVSREEELKDLTKKVKADMTLKSFSGILGAFK